MHTSLKEQDFFLVLYMDPVHVSTAILSHVKGPVRNATTSAPSSFISRLTENEEVHSSAGVLHAVAKFSS